jgi:hypothetical protein
MLTCPHPSCPHEARKRELIKEKKAREAQLPVSLLPMGSIHSGQHCDWKDCSKPITPGMKVYAHCYIPWVICESCMDVREKNYHTPRSKKVTVAEYVEAVKNFVPTKRSKTDMTEYWILSEAI